MSKDYGSWSLADLKSELRKRNAKVTGRKAVLVQRLRDYDVIFGGLINAPDTSYVMTIPNPEEFRDINLQTMLPDLNVGDIERFSRLAERDELAVSQKMYEEEYLLTSRAAEQGNEFFVTSVCASEMRKNITYNVTIKYQTHTILEAQCECAAGMGPYAQCKHILVLMYGLVNFTQNKNIKIRKASTSTLQTFHHPSIIHTGNPVKAEHLKLKTNNINLKKMTLFDPRPCGSQMDSKKYTEAFQNLVINFCGSQNVAMPLTQLARPADKRALYRDHDYLKKTMEEIFLESLHLPEDKLRHLEQATRNNKKYWKEQRKMRLQSSDYGRICKCADKMKLASLLLKSVDMVTPAIKHGIKYEKHAIDKFTEVTGLSTIKCGIIVNKNYQFLGCTPDSLVGDDALLEVKCPYSIRNQVISYENLAYLYLCEETGQMKLKQNHEYFFQIQGQLFCTQRKIAYFCVYMIKDFYCVKIDHDTTFIKNMLEKLLDFYNNTHKFAFLCKHLYNIKT